MRIATVSPKLVTSLTVVQIFSTVSCCGFVWGIKSNECLSTAAAGRCCRNSFTADYSEDRSLLLLDTGGLFYSGGVAGGRRLAQSPISEHAVFDSCDLQPSNCQHFRMNERGDYLHVELPLMFADRYGSGPDKVYIRPCYRDLYDIVSGTMLGPTPPLPVFLFTGVPGIGKSVFLIYLLFRFLNDERFPDKRFLLEFESGYYHWFVPNGIPVEDGVFSFAYSFKSAISNQTPQYFFDVPIFSDSLQRDVPRRRGKWLFVFRLPDPGCDDGRMKIGGTRYTLPTWSHSELLCLEEEGGEQRVGRFDLIGGVPRIIFGEEDPKERLQTIFDSNTSEVIAESFLKSCGFGRVNAMVGYPLFHVNPPKSPSGDGWHFDGAAVWSLASDEIYLRIAKRHRQSLLLQATTIFNAGPLKEIWGISAGYMFEKVCLWLIPLAGDTISVQSLTNLDDPPIDIALPERGLLDHLWKQKTSEGDKLQPNILYQPRTSNSESGCAFCWLPAGVGGDGASTLVVLQITVGEVHPVKVNGQEDIVSAFPEHSIERKLLVFVTPCNGKLGSAQPLHTQKNEVARVIPVSVQGFEQYVCRRKI